MRAALIVDVGAAIGFGHLSRSFVLARALRARGAEVLIIAPSRAEAWRARLAAAGVALAIEPDDAFTDVARAKGLVDAVAALGGPHIAVDHYGAPDALFTRLAEVGASLTRLEDHGRPSRIGERVLCPVPRGIEDDPLAPLDDEPPRGATGGLYGPRYALVDRAYRVARERAPERGACRRVLVSCGGSDPVDLTRTMLAGVLSSAAAGAPELAVDVVLGPAYAWRAALLASAAAQDPRVTVHDAPDGLVELLLSADLALGAPGHTSWERAALRVPSLLALQADNQTGLAAFLAARGAARSLGRAEHVQPGDVASALDVLRVEPDAARALSRAAGALVDGFGAERVVDALQGLAARRADHVGDPTRARVVWEVDGRPCGECWLAPLADGLEVRLMPDEGARGPAAVERRRALLAATLRDHAREARLYTSVAVGDAESLALLQALGFEHDGGAPSASGALAADQAALRLCCDRFVE
ncbi:MAG: hypothetical protein R3F49_08200 [Planctomycetota bacterium]